MPALRSSRIESLQAQNSVLVCQNRTCLKQGAADVLAAFYAQPTSSYSVTKTGCLGQCSNGPMVRVLPDDVWYWQVQSDEVPAIVTRHLLGGQPVMAMLYPKFHSHRR